MARATATEESKRAESPPYVSFRSFLNLLERLEHGGIPQRIDRSYWGAYFSGGYGPQVMAALRFLGLVNEQDEPTPALERLVHGDRKEKLAQVLLDRYGSVIMSLDLARATLGQLDAAFRERYVLSGDTLRKARVFFVHAAQYADIALSKHITEGTRSKGLTAKRNGRTTKKDVPSGTATGHSQDGVQISLQRTNQSKDTETISLRSGDGQVTLSFYLNWFTAEKSDRDFVLDLIDRLRQYRRRSIGHPPLPQETGIPEPPPEYDRDLPDDYYHDQEPPEDDYEVNFEA